MGQNTPYVTTGSWDNFWNGPDLNKKFLKADYQSKRCIMTILSEALAFESTHNNLLTNEAMFTGWDMNIASLVSKVTSLVQ